MGKVKREASRLSESFITGVIALIFLIVGYQTALFIHNAAVMRIAAGRDEPDTVYVYSYGDIPDTSDPAGSMTGQRTERRDAAHSPKVEAVRRNLPRKDIENFVFDPNTVSVDELCRLGFTPKQAQSIDNYRKKGGRFRRKSDFARSYVVSESMFARLEKYIDIPLVDLNAADSADFDALPGIGGWFAQKMIEYRKRLGGYSYKEQLMDIYRFDQEKFDALSDLIIVSPDHVVPYPLWELTEDSLCRHPYIRNRETAHAIVLYKENTPMNHWSVDSLIRLGIVYGEEAGKLSRCFIKAP